MNLFKLFVLGIPVGCGGVNMVVQQPHPESLLGVPPLVVHNWEASSWYRLPLDICC